MEAEGENLGARRDHDRFGASGYRYARLRRLRRRKQEGHSRCDSSLRQRGVSIGDRQIVLIVQIINRAAVEDADRVDAVVSRSRRAGVRRSARIRGVGREQDLIVERGRARKHLLAHPAVARLIEQQLPAQSARRNRRRDAAGDIDEIGVGIVRDRERVILSLGQLVERMVVPNRIEAVLDGRSCAIGRAIGSIQRMSPVARADRH